MSDLKALLARVAQLDECLAEELARHLRREGRRDEWVHDPDGDVRLWASHGQIIAMVYESAGKELALSIADAHDIAASALRATGGIFFPDALSNAIDRQIEQRLRALIQTSESRINSLRTRITFETRVDPDPLGLGVFMRAAGLSGEDEQ